MSTFATLKDKPASEKVVLVELDLAIDDQFFTNYSAFVWYVSFDKLYPDIDASLITAVLAQPEVITIGSVTWDDVPLVSVASVAAVEATSETYYWDVTNRELYVHGIDGNSPPGHAVVVGAVEPFANRGKHFAPETYEARVLSVPNIARRRDPLFFGRLEFGGGTVTLDNGDGALDLLGENPLITGSSARIKVGFDDLGIADYRQVYSGHIREVSIGFDEASIDLRDRRLKLRAQVGQNTFDQTTYPNLNDGNVGSAIPLAYGTLLNIPGVVVNEDEGGSPDWTVKLADPIHSISAITEVRVNGAAITPNSTSLTLAEAVIDNLDYETGDEVTADIVGYVDSGGTVIDNALDVIRDLITEYLPFPYLVANFNLGEWATATAAAPDISLYVDTPTEVVQLIEDISDSVFGLFIVNDAGQFTFRIFNNPGSSTRTIRREDILSISEVSYDAADALTSVRVGYARDWSEGTYQYLTDVSQESTLIEQLRVQRQESFDTLLTNATDAQSFADTVLELSGGVQRLVSITTKMQTVDIDVDDWINVQIDRPVSTMLGFTFCQVVGITRDLGSFEVTLELRIWDLIADPGNQTETIAEGLYGDLGDRGQYYGDGKEYGSAS